jgi:hypothetical protein
VTITWYLPFDSNCTSGIGEFGLSKMRGGVFRLLAVIDMSLKTKLKVRQNAQNPSAASLSMPTRISA